MARSPVCALSSYAVQIAGLCGWSLTCNALRPVAVWLAGEVHAVLASQSQHILHVFTPWKVAGSSLALTDINPRNGNKVLRYSAECQQCHHFAKRFDQ